ncbi:type VII toxin-antitoxin system MntA family adenylyltransferase antitoxin [Candidatus Nitrospira salsa]|nr:MAG: hypothetical protein NPIRA01_32000 [Nitrospirales bacterium]
MSLALKQLVENVKTDERVLAVLLFGSQARGEAHARSDTDVCLVLAPNSDTPDESANVRLTYVSSFDLDLHVFQALPLPVRPRVLKDGEVLFCRNSDQLYDIALRTIREYRDFRPRYQLYLNQIANA